MNKRPNSLFLTSVLLSLCLLFTACSPAVGKSNGPAETKTADRGIASPSTGVGRYDENAEPHNITICIDPGHGFDDNGCTSDFLPDHTEKELTLLYANLVRDKLEQLGYTVIMTHDGESFPQEFNENGNNKYSPEERTAYANSQQIDYYLSLHCDSFNEDYSVGGTRIYYCESNAKKQLYSVDVANAIQARLNQTFPDDKEVAVHNMKVSESYYVIRETYAAASLIEVGFITNEADVSKLMDADWQKAFSVAVAEGIDDYFITVATTESVATAEGGES